MLPLYDNIRRRRIELNLSQEALAKKLKNTSSARIAEIEMGKIQLSMSDIQAFAKALNITPGRLMGWTKQSNISTWRYKTIENDRIVMKLLGLSDDGEIQADIEAKAPFPFDISPNTFILSEREKTLILTYRNNMKFQQAIDKLIDETSEKDNISDSTSEN